MALNLSNSSNLVQLALKGLIKSLCVNYVHVCHVFRWFDGLTHSVLQFVEFWGWVVERMMVECDTDFTEEVVASKSVAVPDHHTQRPRFQLTLRYVILHTQPTQISGHGN